jgi:putative restriction endonuclease
MFGDRRSYAGNHGYDDEATTVYRYDNFVQNYKRLAAGDVVVLAGPSELIGFARISAIQSRAGEKKRLRCPVCQTSALKQRETMEPAYRCDKGHEFGTPTAEVVPCRLFDAELEGFVATPALIDLEEVRKACPNYASQLAMQEIDVRRMRLPFDRFPDLILLLTGSS